MFFKALNLVLQPVSIGSLEHLLPILFAAIFAVTIILFSKKRLNYKQKQYVFRTLGIVMSLTIVIYHLYKILTSDYNFNTDLPLFLCSFMALTIPFFTETRSYFLYEILLFWVIAGTSQGVITPDIPEGVPSFDFFRYWITHLGLLVIVFYATFVFNMRPTLKSVFKSFLILQVYMLVLMGINYMLNANYSYLNRKPNSASVLDFLGEWPTYIFVIEAVLLPYFLLIYLPFYISKKIIKRTI